MLHAIECITEFGSDSNDRDYWYNSILGDTELLAVSTSPASTGQLAPGRYVVQVESPTGDTVYLRTQRSNDISGLTAAPPAYPINNGLLSTFEFNVREGYNDYLQGITSAGSFNVYVTRIG